MIHIDINNKYLDANKGRELAIERKEEEWIRRAYKMLFKINERYIQRLISMKKSISCKKMLRNSAFRILQIHLGLQHHLSNENISS